MALWTLFGLASGKATTDWPREGRNNGQEGVLGILRYHADACSEGCEECASVCPTHAIEARDRALAVDYGRCIVCDLCTEACPTGAMEPSNDGRSASASRRSCRWRPGRASSPATLERKAFRRSLHIRHVDAGSCNGCEFDCRLSTIPSTICTASASHAIATLRRRSSSQGRSPTPCIAAQGGLRRHAGAEMGDGGRDLRRVRRDAGGNYACGAGLDGVLPVDVYLPGCRRTRPQSSRRSSCFSTALLSASKEGGSVVTSFLRSLRFWARAAILAIVGDIMLTGSSSS